MSEQTNILNAQQNTPPSPSPEQHDGANWATKALVRGLAVTALAGGLAGDSGYEHPTATVASGVESTLVVDMPTVAFPEPEDIRFRVAGDKVSIISSPVILKEPVKTEVNPKADILPSVADTLPATVPTYNNESVNPDISVEILMPELPDATQKTTDGTVISDAVSDAPIESGIDAPGGGRITNPNISTNPECAPNANRNLTIDVLDVYDTRAEVSKIDFFFNDATEIRSTRSKINEGTDPAAIFGPIIEKLKSMGINVQLDALPQSSFDTYIGKISDFPVEKQRIAAQNAVDALAWMPKNRLEKLIGKEVFITAQAILNSSSSLDAKPIGGQFFSAEEDILFTVDALSNSKEWAKEVITHEYAHDKQYKDCIGSIYNDKKLTEIIESAGLSFKDPNLRTSDEIADILKRTGISDMYGLTNSAELHSVITQQLMIGDLVVAGDPDGDKIIAKLYNEVLARMQQDDPQSVFLAVFARQYKNLVSEYATPAEILELRSEISPHDVPVSDDSFSSSGKFQINGNGEHRDWISLHTSKDGSDVVSVRALNNYELGITEQGIDFDPQTSPLVQEIIKSYNALNRSAQHSKAVVTPNQQGGKIYIFFPNKDLTPETPPVVTNPTDNPSSNPSGPEVITPEIDRQNVLAEYEKTGKFNVLDAAIIIKDKSTDAPEIVMINPVISNDKLVPSKTNGALLDGYVYVPYVDEDTGKTKLIPYNLKDYNFSIVYFGDPAKPGAEKQIVSPGEVRGIDIADDLKYATEVFGEPASVPVGKKLFLSMAGQVVGFITYPFSKTK